MHFVKSLLCDADQNYALVEIIFPGVPLCHWGRGQSHLGDIPGFSGIIGFANETLPHRLQKLGKVQ